MSGQGQSEELDAVVPWEVFGKPPAKTLKGSDSAKRNRPSDDPLRMFEITALQVQYGLLTNQAQSRIGCSSCGSLGSVTATRSRMQ